MWSHAVNMYTCIYVRVYYVNVMDHIAIEELGEYMRKRGATFSGETERKTEHSCDFDMKNIYIF